MKKGITVRDFTASDMERILEFREETAGVSFPGVKMDRDNAKRTILRHAERYPGTLKVAEAKGSQIGFIMFKPKKGSLGEYGYIDIIFVQRIYRDQGVGALLLKEAESWFRKKGISRINATITNTNLPSLAFFREHGYLPKRTVVEKKRLGRPSSKSQISTTAYSP